MPVEATDTLAAEVFQIAVGGMPGRNVEMRKVISLESEIEVAHLGDADRVRQRFRHLAEDPRHLLGSLEIELIRFRLEPLRIAQRGVCLHADEQFLGGRIAFVAVVNVVRRHQWQVEFAGERDQLPVGLDLLLDPVVLNLDVEAIRSQDLRQFARVVDRLVRLSVQEVVRDRTAETGGGRDDALAMILEHLQVDPGPVVEPFETGLGRKFEEVAVTGVVLGEQEQVVGLPLLDRRLSLGEVSLHPDDRVQTGLGPRLVPVHGGVHDTMVGHRHVVDPEFLGAGDVLVDPAHTVKQGVLGVQM